MNPGGVVIISGPPGAGKTSASRQVVAQLERGVRIETDFFFAAIGPSFIEPWRAEAHAQNTAVVRACARAAATFAEAGYDVVVDGVVLPWALDIYRAELAPLAVTPVYVVLLPRVEVATTRGLARDIPVERRPGSPIYREMHRPAERAPDAPVYREMHRQFAALTGVTTLDTGKLSRHEVAEAILRLCAEAPGP